MKNFVTLLLIAMFACTTTVYAAEKKAATTTDKSDISPDSTKTATHPKLKGGC
ncbi:MAG: hypothetical protein RBR22_01980 [Desulfuromonas sp.]|nr:hypothetical protein [Desulfuromonas sp.]